MSLEVRFLSDDEITQWDDLVNRSPQGCIFCQSWWIKAACGQNFKILGCFRNGRLLAGIPLHFVWYGPFRVCSMPKLTQNWGPVLEPVEGKYVTRLSREMDLLKALADRLSHMRLFFQCFHHSLTNWLPFYWTGFRQTTIYTYILDDISDEGVLWSGMRQELRTDIRKAERRSITVSSAAPADFLVLCEKTFARQGIRRPFSQEFFFSIANAAKERDAGDCFVASDEKGRPHAGIFAVWDQRYLYGLTAGADPALRSSAAYSLLLWWLIRFARGRSRGFDFGGSNLPQVEPLLRAFGARQQPVNRIIKAPLWGRVALTALGKL